MRAESKKRVNRNRKLKFKRGGSKIGLRVTAKIIPLARRRRGITSFWRRTRGFSLGELREAGLTVHQARKLGLTMDLRRRSKHEENVKKLKEFSSLSEPT